MKEPLSDKLRVLHVLGAITEVENYLRDVLFEDFENNSEKKFATIKQIEIIGEACSKISPDLKEKHPEVEWKPIIGFRNISIHEYFGINLKIVWEIGKNDLPELKKQFSSILNDFGDR